MISNSLTLYDFSHKYNHKTQTFKRSSTLEYLEDLNR